MAGPGRLTKFHYCTSMTGRHEWRQLLPRSNSEDGETPPSQAMLRPPAPYRGKGIAWVSSFGNRLPNGFQVHRSRVPQLLVSEVDCECSGGRFRHRGRKPVGEHSSSLDCRGRRLQSSLRVLWRSALPRTSEDGLAHFSGPLTQRLGSASCGASGLVVVEGATRPADSGWVSRDLL